MPTFSAQSELAIDPDLVLANLTIQSVNSELWPLVRMTAPSTWDNIPLANWPVRARLFNSWILLIGIFPVDLHFFYLDQVDPDRGFSESSTSLVNRRWDHTREVIPSAAGCWVRDTIRYENRLPVLGYLLLPFYRLVFWNRHRRLKRHFG